MRLFAGDDWAQDHHDIEVMDEAGRVLARRRLGEGAGGMAQLHALVGGLLGEDADDAEVLVGIETDHGPWVMALIAAGYRVFPVNPQQSARFRARHAVSGAKSDAGDAHVLADMVRTDSHQLREAAGAPKDTATMTPCGAWPTGSSASSTAASKPAPSTTRTPPGATGSRQPLDKLSPWDV